MGKLKRMTVICACAVLMAGGLAAMADEVTDLIQKSEKAYTEKNYKQSVKFLNQAAKRIHDLLAEKLASFLPKEIEGWKRGEVKKETLGDDAGQFMLLSGFFSAQVTYRKIDGPEKVEVTITNAPQLIQMARIPMELVKNPFFKQMNDEEGSGEKVEAYALEGMEGYKRTANDVKESDLFLFQGDLMLQAQGKDMAQPERLEKFIKQSDLEGIKNFAGAE